MKNNKDKPKALDWTPNEITNLGTINPLIGIVSTTLLIISIMITLNVF